MKGKKDSDGLDAGYYEIIEEREEELDELISNFVCDLMDFDDDDERNVFLDCLEGEIESLKDEFEEVLSNHGINIYRPVIVEDDDGNEVALDSIYDNQ